MFLFDLIAIIVFVIIIAQDFMTRSVSWILFPLLMVLYVFKSVMYMPTNEFITNLLFNLGFVSVQMLALILYFSFRNRKPTVNLKKYLGAGDVMLLYIFCFVFSPFNLILFLTTSQFFALILWGGYLLFSKQKKQTTVPLAGLLSASVALIVLVGNFIPDWNLYNDQWIINFVIAYE